MRTFIRPWLRWLVLAFALATPDLASAQGDARPFSQEQLDQLTAQVALYPDALLSQVLMASTYPADVADAANWSRTHSDAKGDGAAKMVENEPWDPSVQSLVAFPQVIIMMGEKPDWVKDLGDAFLAQPDAVMDSVCARQGFEQMSKVCDKRHAATGCQGRVRSIAAAENAAQTRAACRAWPGPPRPTRLCDQGGEDSSRMNGHRH